MIKLIIVIITILILMIKKIIQNQIYDFFNII